MKGCIVVTLDLHASISPFAVNFRVKFHSQAGQPGISDYV
jgi:hypothetical protein